MLGFNDRKQSELSCRSMNHDRFLYVSKADHMAIKTNNSPYYVNKKEECYKTNEK